MEIRVGSTLPPHDGGPPYEAIYFVGYNREHDLYAMHLLDTFGVTLTCTVGVGRREGNSISFVFDYEGTPFTNRFEWQADENAWSFEQTYAADGEVRTFATKRMVRAPWAAAGSDGDRNGTGPGTGDRRKLRAAQ